MSYPHQQGSPNYDGAEAFEAYLNAPRLTLTCCPECHGDGCERKSITVYEHGCGFPHADVEEIKCETCGGTGEIAVEE